jgi:hypothetical protein
MSTRGAAYLRGGRTAQGDVTGDAGYWTAQTSFPAQTG